MITYQYAYIRESAQITDISEINEDNRRHAKYSCINCSGEMIPSLGKVKTHHFRHKHETNCSYETYLHKTSKVIIKDYFDNNDTYIVPNKISESCSKINECIIHKKYRPNECEGNYVQKINLKEYYDTCELESSHKNSKYIADVLLTHSKHPERSLYIEIYVTHECSKEKIESGIRIVEIRINNEDDLKKLLSGHLNSYKLHNFKQINHVNLEKLVIRCTERPYTVHPYTIDCHKFKGFNNIDITYDTLGEVIVPHGKNNSDKVNKTIRALIYKHLRYIDIANDPCFLCKREFIKKTRRSPCRCYHQNPLYKCHEFSIDLSKCDKQIESHLTHWYK